MSAWDRLIAALTGAAGTAVDEASAIGTGFMDDMLPSRNMRDSEVYDRPPAKKLGDVGPYLDPEAGAEYDNQMLMDVNSVLSSPFRMLERAGDFYFGDGEREPPRYPLTRMDVPGNMERVTGGFSNGEEAKANAKLMEAQARAMSQQTEMQERQEAEVMRRLETLRGASKAKDVFVAKGDTTMGVTSPDGGSGSFTKSNRPVVEQDAIRRLLGQGMDENKAQGLVDAKGSRAADEVIAQAALAEGQTPSIKELLQMAASSKDAIGFMAVLEKLGIIPPQKK